MNALHGHSVWILFIALILGVPSVLAAEKRVISTDIAREVQGVCFGLIGAGVHGSGFDLDAGIPYALRVVVLLVLIAVFASFGRWLYSCMEPETAAERALP